MNKIFPRYIRSFIGRTLEKIIIDFRTAIVKIQKNPLFIIGNQKSGTTAIAALLANMCNMSVTLDLKKEIDNPTYHRVRLGELPFSDFIKINKLDFSRQIIKEPNLTLLYECLAKHFPDSKFVFVLRDPRENIRSILNRLKIPGNLNGLDDKHRIEITKAWELIIDNNWLGLKGENYIEMLAARWNFTTDVFLEHQDTMIIARYEEFEKDKVGEIYRLSKELGLPQVNDIEDKVDVQFQPPGDKSLSWQDFFGVLNLGGIESICGERMRLLNYLLLS